MAGLTLVKVGGSLFDLPELGPALRRWHREQSPQRLLFVPGGGAAADAVRQYHQTHHLPEELSHWLAIDMMIANAKLLRYLLQDEESTIDIAKFCSKDDGHPYSLPHTWRVTSDSIAARMAEFFQMRELVLLKSVDLPQGLAWTKAAERGLVDWTFNDVIKRSKVAVRWVNFRKWMIDLVTLEK